MLNTSKAPLHSLAFHICNYYGSSNIYRPYFEDFMEIVKVNVFIFWILVSGFLTFQFFFSHFIYFAFDLKYHSSISPEELRISGKCPLTPEEAALMLSALGYKRETYIYLAGSRIYGGLSRLQPFMQLFPNVVTKEDLLSPEELKPFKNFSSQVLK